MKRYALLFLAAVAFVLLASASVAVAEDSCTCSRQTDGSTWCTCVDDNGNMYCETCPANGGACSRVSCSS
jgi:hypothetical protein